MSKITTAKLSSTLLCLLAIAAASALASVPRAVSGGERDAPAVLAGGLRVAVVDMDRVLQKSAEWRDSTEERTRILDRRKRALTNLSRSVQVLSNHYESLPPGTDERRSKGRQVEQALNELQQGRLEFDELIAQHHNEAVRRIFRKVSAAVKAYSEEHGINLVLKRQAFDFAGPETVEQGLMIATTEVLYADPALDISEAITQRLNAAYPAPIEAQ